MIGGNGVGVGVAIKGTTERLVGLLTWLRKWTKASTNIGTFSGIWGWFASNSRQIILRESTIEPERCRSLRMRSSGRDAISLWLIAGNSVTAGDSGWPIGRALSEMLDSI